MKGCSQAFCSIVFPWSIRALRNCGPTMNSQGFGCPGSRFPSLAQSARDGAVALSFPSLRLAYNYSGLWTEGKWQPSGYCPLDHTVHWQFGNVALSFSVESPSQPQLLLHNSTHFAIFKVVLVPFSCLNLYVCTNIFWIVIICRIEKPRVS